MANRRDNKQRGSITPRRVGTILNGFANGRTGKQIASRMKDVSVHQVNAVLGNATLGYYDETHPDQILRIFG